MKTKKIVIVTLLLFWAFITAVLLSGFTNMSKLTNNIITGSVISNQDNEVLAKINTSISQLNLTKDEISKHNFVSNCWMIISNKVYDVTSYIPIHPGGSASITSYCGKDATQAFNAVGHSSNAAALLNQYYIGDLNSQAAGNITSLANTLNNRTQNNTIVILTNNTNSTQITTIQTSNSSSVNNQILTIQEISKHNFVSNCWMIISNKVYDVTSYIPIHPGGSASITSYCGKDATQAFNAVGHSSNAAALLNQYYIGDLNSQAENTGNTTNQIINQTGPSNITNPTVPRINTTVPKINLTNQTVPFVNTTNPVVPEINTTVPKINLTNQTNLISNTTNQTIPSQNHLITKEEISKHRYSYNCWSYTGTKVYDLTSYISRYPSGPGAILNICGKNGTELFSGSDNLSFLNTYFIGNLAGTSQDSFREDDDGDDGEDDD